MSQLHRRCHIDKGQIEHQILCYAHQQFTKADELSDWIGRLSPSPTTSETNQRKWPSSRQERREEKRTWLSCLVICSLLWKGQGHVSISRRRRHPLSFPFSLLSSSWEWNGSQTTAVVVVVVATDDGKPSMARAPIFILLLLLLLRPFPFCFLLQQQQQVVSCAVCLCTGSVGRSVPG